MDAGWSRNGVNGFWARMTALASRPVLGFQFWDTTFDGADPPRRAVGAVVPFWAVAGLFAVLPSLWGRGALRRRRRAARVRRGLCAACGYDLRGARGGCPECGSARVGEVPV